MSYHCSIFQDLFVIICLIFASVINKAACSGGDHSYVFQRCLTHCHQRSCVDDALFRSEHPITLRLLQWSCDDECKYSCMWPTVEAYQKDRLPVPQFYGKWPFVRLWGIQEPASAIFSVLNFLAHLFIFDFRRQVPKTAPMYTICSLNSFVAMNTWLWSTVFHIRDTYFTERMDYFCAFSLVLSNFLTLCCRMLGPQRWLWQVLVFVILAALYFYHVCYLAFVKFDYGYNMKVNIIVGVSNMLGWLYWSYLHRDRQYVRKCVFVMIFTAGLMSLELFDFPPLFWTFDAHSLWHLGTAPLALIWISFITEDTLYDLDQQERRDLIKKSV